MVIGVINNLIEALNFKQITGLLVFVDNKQYIIVKSKEGDADGNN